SMNLRDKSAHDLKRAMVELVHQKIGKTATENNLRSLGIHAGLTASALFWIEMNYEIEYLDLHYIFVALLAAYYVAAAFIFLTPTDKPSMYSIFAPVLILAPSLFAILTSSMFSGAEPLFFLDLMGLTFLFLNLFLYSFLVLPLYDTQGELLAAGGLIIATFLPSLSLLIGLSLKKWICRFVDVDQLLNDMSRGVLGRGAECIESASEDSHAQSAKKKVATFLVKGMMILFAVSLLMATIAAIVAVFLLPGGEYL
ncbi:MAG: hypothetical protein FWC81_02750, partial [Coriobacteriia bacterium]|nr:hypothetical protein [Coriobacteriia bacterium]